MNGIDVLAGVGVILCILAFRTVDLLRKLADSASILSKDRQSAIETQTVAITTAILICGKLANPRYKDELNAWRHELSEAKRNEKEANEQWGSKDRDADEPLTKLVQEFEQELHKADAFHEEGRRYLSEMAAKIYQCAKESHD